MFIARLISKVRKELNLLGFLVEGELEIVEYNDDFCLVNLENNDECFYIKYYDDGISASFIKNIKKLESYGIKLEVVGYSNKIAIYRDFSKDGFYRRVNKEDFKDREFIVNLAKWYKKIHSIDLNDFEFEGNCDLFSLENICDMERKLGLINFPFLNNVKRNFENIKLKYERLNKCIVVGGVVLDELYINKNDGTIMVNNFNNLFKGNRCFDIASVLSLLDCVNKEIFLEEYGQIKKEEFICCDVVGCVINLIFASKCKCFPAWTGGVLRKVQSKEMLENVNLLVNWY